MSGLTGFLQAELLALSNEARRKYPEIKEATERLGIILRSYKERPGHSIARELSRTDDSLRPFILACETKQIKLITIAINCIQKLISFQAIPETSIGVILRTLTDISSKGVEIQLKILQAVLPLLNNYRHIHNEILAETLLICFRLQDSKSAVVNNTAIATLRQLVIFVFDKVVKEDAQKPVSLESTQEIENVIRLLPCAKDAYYLFRDLCLLTNNDQSQFLNLSHLSKTFGIELIESVLANHYTLFREHKELVTILKELLCPMIIKFFSEKHDYPQTIRTVRVIFILVKHFDDILTVECGSFLSILLKLLEPENPLWLRVLSMEVFKSICNDFSLIRFIYKWYDGQGNTINLFSDMIAGFGKLATEKPQSISSAQKGRENHDFRLGSNGIHSSSTAHNNSIPTDVLCVSKSTMRIKCIDQLDKTDPPLIPETYIFYLTLTSINSIADGLAGYTLPIFSPVQSSTHNIIKLSIKDEKSEKDIGLITDIANVAWPGLLATMSFYLKTNLDEELFQSALRSYQNFTNVCGVLNLVTPRDTFLTNLCKTAIPMAPILSSGWMTASNSSLSKSSHNATNNSSNPGLSTSAISYTELPAQQQQTLANVKLNDKNLYTLRALLNITMYLSNVLEESWYLVLETLMMADFLLFNRPNPKGPSGGNINIAASTSATTSIKRGAIGSSLSSSTINQSNQSVQLNNQSLDADQISLIHSSFDRLFENSKYLDDKSFISFSSALCRLSSEISGTPFSEKTSIQSNKSSMNKFFNNRSFAIEKLEYIVTLNMERLMHPERESSSKIWTLITNHFIATANYPLTPSPIRTQCCDIIGRILTSAMNHVFIDDYEKTNKMIQQRLLFALQQCINYSVSNESSGMQSGNTKVFGEVQKMGLSTLNSLLQTWGHSFTCGWDIIFDMLRHIAIYESISSHQKDGEDEEDQMKKDSQASPNIKKKDTGVTKDSSASSLMAGPSMTTGVSKPTSGLIKMAFSNLQLICTDFLSLLSPDCLRLCIMTLGAFCSQCDDLNISLTAVGLLWNLSDFFQTKRLDLEKQSSTNGDSIKRENLNIDLKIGTEENAHTYSMLWMLLLSQLSQTCTDWRPEVRNGANQTLFRTITMNGSVLGPSLWYACIWQVLFPLLDSIKMCSMRAMRLSLLDKSSSQAGNTSDRDTSSGFMLCHARDTTEKQWDETKVLMLTGLASIYHDFLTELYELEDFELGFNLLLAHLEDSGLRSSHEVALASIKSLTTIVRVSSDFKNPSYLMHLWHQTWNTWKVIGFGISHITEQEDEAIVAHDHFGENSKDKAMDHIIQSLSPSHRPPISEDFTQETLESFVKLFIDLYQWLRSSFSLSDFRSLLNILRNILVYSTSPQYRPDIDHMSPLQEAVLEVIESLDMTAEGVPPLVLADVAEYMTFAFLSPADDDNQHKNRGYIPPSQRKFSTVTYVGLNKRCNVLVGELFKTHAGDLSLYTEGVFERILGAYGLPMKLKYDCPPSYKHSDNKTPLWKLATGSLLDILKIGLEQIENFGEDVPFERFYGVWCTLVDIVEGSLLSPSLPPEHMKIEALDIDEQFDISVLETICRDVMIHLGHPRVPVDLIEKFIAILRECSRLYYVEDSLISSDTVMSNQDGVRTSMSLMNDRSSDIVGTTGTIVPVMKESFAYASFMTLFHLCSVKNKDYPGRVGKIVIHVLLERCETILRNYTADEPLLGRCPFPRYLMGVRKEEMLFLLHQSIQLELQDQIFTPDVNDNQTAVKHLLLSGPRAHLFYLYPSLCNMITCKDEIVVNLIQECLNIIGLEMGLLGTS